MTTKVKLLHDTVGIPTGAVAVTQSASDNTTKVATTAYVTTALANLADSAPSTLNTLNELAAALGDDANFSTTVTNSIATKLPLAGGTLTGNLTLYSSAPVLAIKDGGTHGTNSTPYLEFRDGSSVQSTIGITNTAGDLSVWNSKNTNLRFATNNTEKLRIDSSGALGLGTTPPSGTHTTWSQLFTGTKASIISENTSGVGGLDGTWLTDNLYIKQSTGSFANITTNESSAILLEGGKIKFYSQGSGSADAAVTVSQKMVIDSSGRVGIGEPNPNSPLHVKTTNQSIQVRNTGNDNIGLEIYRDSDGAKGASFAWGNGNANLEIKNYRNDGQAAGPYANIDFFTGGTTADSPDYAPTRRMRIQQTGEVGIGTDNPTHTLDVTGTIRAYASGSGNAWLYTQNDNKVYITGVRGSSSNAYSIYDLTADVSRFRVNSDGGIAIGENNVGYAGQILSIKAGTGDNVLYGESSDSKCILSLRDNSSTQNIGYGAVANAHVFFQDGTEVARISTGSGDKYSYNGGGIGGSGSNLHLHGDDCELKMANNFLHSDNSGNTKFTIRTGYGATSSAAELSLDGGYISLNTGTSFTERWRVNSSGHFTPGQQHTVDIGGTNAEVRNIYAQGISFASNANYSGMSSELLDDYEEGYYDATISCASGSITLYTSYTRLRYTKIGRLVHIHGKLAVNSVSSPTGATNLNLPFVISNDTNRSGQADNIMTGYFNGSAITNGIYPIYGNMAESTSVCRLFVMIIPATHNLGDNYTAQGTDYHINFTYTTD